MVKVVNTPKAGEVDSSHVQHNRRNFISVASAAAGCLLSGSLPSLKAASGADLLLEKQDVETPLDAVFDVKLSHLKQLLLEGRVEYHTCLHNFVYAEAYHRELITTDAGKSYLQTTQTTPARWRTFIEWSQARYLESVCEADRVANSDLQAHVLTDLAQKVFEIGLRRSTPSNDEAALIIGKLAKPFLGTVDRSSYDSGEVICYRLKGLEYISNLIKKISYQVLERLSIHEEYAESMQATLLRLVPMAMKETDERLKVPLYSQLFRAVKTETFRFSDKELQDELIAGLTKHYFSVSTDNQLAAEQFLRAVIGPNSSGSWCRYLISELTMQNSIYFCKHVSAATEKLLAGDDICKQYEIMSLVVKFFTSVFPEELTRQYDSTFEPSYSEDTFKAASKLGAELVQRVFNKAMDHFNKLDVQVKIEGGTNRKERIVSNDDWQAATAFLNKQHIHPDFPLDCCISIIQDKIVDSNNPYLREHAYTTLGMLLPETQKNSLDFLRDGLASESSPQGAKGIGTALARLLTKGRPAGRIYPIRASNGEAYATQPGFANFEQKLEQSVKDFRKTTTEVTIRNDSDQKVRVTSSSTEANEYKSTGNHAVFLSFAAERRSSPAIHFLAELINYTSGNFDKVFRDFGTPVPDFQADLRGKPIYNENNRLAKKTIQDVTHNAYLALAAVVNSISRAPLQDSITAFLEDQFLASFEYAPMPRLWGEKFAALVQCWGVQADRSSSKGVMYAFTSTNVESAMKGSVKNVDDLNDRVDQFAKKMISRLPVFSNSEKQRAQRRGVREEFAKGFLGAAPPGMLSHYINHLCDANGFRKLGYVRSVVTRDLI